MKRNPKLSGVPLVLWLPSTLTAINIFLLGSIDKASHKVWYMDSKSLGLLFVIRTYVSYEKGKAFEKERKKKKGCGDRRRVPPPHLVFCIIGIHKLSSRKMDKI